MGMAASQARLLSLTARLHDVEYEAQALQNAKLQLATQSDQVYNEYLEALDATTLTVSMINGAGQTSTVTANFNNLCSVNRVRPADGSEYALFNKYNQLIVSEDVYQGYVHALQEGYDAYGFAMYMLAGNDEIVEYEGTQEGLEEIEESVYEELKEGKFKNNLDGLRQSILECIPEDSDANGIYATESDFYNEYSELDKEAYDQYQKLITQYKHMLYSNLECNKNIYEAAIEKFGDTDLSPAFDSDKFQYYVSIFNQIESNPNGCISITTFNGFNGDAANNSDWLKSQIESGQITISIVNTNRKNGEVNFTGTGVSSDTSLNYTNTTEIDKRAMAKAEAKYEHDLKEIDKKDKKYDMTLSKLETERTALTTEYDSVKKVIEDNIERTFGIFS